MRSLGTLCALLAACGSSPGFQPCAITCGPGDACPSGAYCFDGFCHEETPPQSCGVVPPDAPVDSAIADMIVGCPHDYASMDDSCYRVEPLTRDWLAAEQDCEDDAPGGAHLIVVDSIDEHTLLHGIQPDEDAWVGYSDRVTEGAFLWVTAAGTFVPEDASQCFWGPGGPDAPDCAAQAHDNTCGDWHTYGCDTTLSYVCEYDGKPALPSRY